MKCPNPEHNYAPHEEHAKYCHKCGLPLIDDDAPCGEQPKPNSHIGQIHKTENGMPHNEGERQQSNLICPNCGATNHESGANYCHICSHVLVTDNDGRNNKHQKSFLPDMEIRPELVIYATLIIIFTFLSILSLFTAWNNAFDSVLWARLFFLGMILLGFFGGMGSLIKYHKSGYKDVLIKDDVNSSTVLFVCDSLIIIPGILISSWTIWLKLLTVAFVILLIAISEVIKKKIIH